MPYIVRNMTSRTVVLSDLRVELGPYKTLDLEKVISADRVEQSGNLRHALDIGALCLVKYSVIHGPRRLEAPAKESLGKVEMETLIRRVMSEYQTNPEPVVIPPPAETKDNTEAVGRIIEDSMSKLMDSIRGEINSIQISGGGEAKSSGLAMPAVDQAKLAEMQQKAIAKISEGVSASMKQGRKIKIKNRDLDNLASELGD